MNIDTDKIVGAYAVATMIDGTKRAEVMNISQLKKAWDQRMGGLKEDATSTHTKFRDQMAKKTVINRLCKMVANTSTDMAYVSDTYDRLEEMESINTTAIDVAHDIKQNANTEEFVPVVESEIVECEVVEAELPDFMYAE